MVLSQRMGVLWRAIRAAHTPRVALIAGCLLVAPLVVGRASVFTDTAYYYAQGEYFAHKLNLWPFAMDGARLMDPASQMAGSAGVDQTMNASFLAARSPTYGLLLYLAERIGSLWLVVLLQSAAAAWAVALWYRAALGRFTWKQAAATGLVLGTATSLPFFTSFAMPDVFASIAIICAVTLLVLGDRLSSRERVFAVLLIALAAGFHLATMLIVAAITMVAVALLLWQRGDRRSFAARVAAVFAAVAASWAPSAVLQGIYALDTGQKQSSPPFLMARVFADGPGRTYLNRHCPGGAAPSLCRFAGTRGKTVDDFLWNMLPDVGVMSNASPQLRQRLRREQTSYVVQSVMESPVEAALSALRNWGEQVVSIYVLEPGVSPTIYRRNEFWARTSLTYVAPVLPWSDIAENWVSTSAITILLWCHLYVIAVTLVLAARGSRRLLHSGLQASGQLLLISALLVGFGVIINAGVCGILSGPFARYGARVVWLLPAASLLVCFGAHSAPDQRETARSPRRAALVDAIE